MLWTCWISLSSNLLVFIVFCTFTTQERDRLLIVVESYLPYTTSKFFCQKTEKSASLQVILDFSADIVKVGTLNLVFLRGLFLGSWFCNQKCFNCCKFWIPKLDGKIMKKNCWKIKKLWAKDNFSGNSVHFSQVIIVCRKSHATFFCSLIG